MLLVRALAIVLVLVLAAFPALAAEKESAYERVMRTGTIRCGYAPFEPFMLKDPNTGKLSGIFFDVTERMGTDLGLKIEWIGEIDFGQIAEALASKKIDAFCSGMAATPERGRRMAFSMPAFFGSLDVIVKDGDTRFDSNIDDINNPNVTIATNDGDISEEIAKQDFPLAKRLPKIQTGGDSELLLNVASGKADVTFTNRAIVFPFMKNNPGKIRIVPVKKPVRLFSVGYATDIHEDALLKVIDNALMIALNNGAVEKMIVHYTKDTPGLFLLPTHPYRDEKP